MYKCDLTYEHNGQTVKLQIVQETRMEWEGARAHLDATGLQDAKLKELGTKWTEEKKAVVRPKVDAAPPCTCWLCAELCLKHNR